jgi:hypothetical protein
LTSFGAASQFEPFSAVRMDFKANQSQHYKRDIEYAAPTELVILWVGFYKYSAPTALGGQRQRISTLRWI